MQAAHAFTRGAEHQGRAAVEIAQQVHGRAFRIMRGHGHGPVLDVPVRLARATHVDAQRVLLVAPGQGGNFLGDRRAEHQRAALGALLLGRRVQDELQILAEAEVKHLVRFVQNGSAQLGEVEASALDMVAQAARRADHDVCAGREHLLLRPAIHAADACGDARAGFGIQPSELALDLHRKLARRRNHKGQWRTGAAKPVLFAQQRGGDGQPVGDGFAGPGLCRHQQVPAGGLVHKHRGLHAGRLGIIPRSEGAGEGGCHVWEWHGRVLGALGRQRQQIPEMRRIS